MSYETGIRLEEKSAFLFQPDTLIPALYFDTLRRTAPLEPEKRLLFAVLEDAIGCYQRYLFAKDRKGKQLFQDAQEWFLDRDNDWLFSFEYICDVIGLDPGHVRQGLLTWKNKKAGRAGQAPPSGTGEEHGTQGDDFRLCPAD